MHTMPNKHPAGPGPGLKRFIRKLGVSVGATLVSPHSSCPTCPSGQSSPLALPTPPAQITGGGKDGLSPSPSFNHQL